MNAAAGSFARHSRAIALAVLLLTLGGIIAATRMPVSLFPLLSYPRVVVSIDAGERDASQMALEITGPVETALRAVPGVTRLRSTTSRGSAEVALNFAWAEDMVAAKLATEAALAATAPDLPPGTRFVVRRMDPTIFPVLGMALTSDSLDQASLRQIAELKVRPALTSVPGVAGVDILGGSPRELAVDVDPAKLAGLGLSITAVRDAVANANIVEGTGRIEDRHRLYLVLADQRVESSAALAAIPIRSTGGGVVTLGQIASIHPATAPDFTRVTANGHAAVLINVRQALAGDTVAIVQAVGARLKSAGIPPSVHVSPYYDQSELVTGAAEAVRDAILFGAVLAGLVLYVFLRSWRLMLITAITLPAVLAGTALLLYGFGLSFNIMTLGGMAAAVGLIIDDAVVMLEHVMRRMEEGTAPDAPSRLAAAAQMHRPLLGSTLATMVVFLPLAFVTGVTGGFFKALAVTMVASLALSALYARVVIPLIAAHWLRDEDVAAARRAEQLTDRAVHAYERGAARVLARPGLAVCLVGIGGALLGWLAWNHVPSGFMPAMDEGGFVLDYKARPGAALTDTNRLLGQVEAIIAATPEVASYSRRTGAQLGGGLSEADEGDFFVRMKGGSRRDVEEVMAEIRQKIAAQVPGLEIELTQLMEDLIGDLTAVPQPVEVKLFSQDSAALDTAAGRVAKALGSIPGVVEIVDGQRVAGDAVALRIDAGAAAQAGLDARAVSDQVGALIGGVPATSVRIGEQLVTVRVRGAPELAARVATLARLPLVTPDGRSVTLGQIAQITVVAGQKQQTREDLAPFVAVTARLEGTDLGTAMKAVRAQVAALHLPASIRVDYGGLYAEQQKSFADLSLVFAAALLLTALLVTVLFERLRWTLAALATALLSACAVLAGLWATGIELNISALMGLTMVVGMVTELSIFFLAEIDPARPLDAAHLARAGAKRLRPILMSAGIAILTLAPLALGFSRGAGLQQPLATAIIFGLTAAVPLVTLVLPAIVLLQRKPDQGANSDIT